MKERPILFSAPMVRAILEGRKTQTRRVIEPQPDWIRPSVGDDGVAHGYCSSGPAEGIRCHYGVPGDRLWVRETWAPCRDFESGLHSAIHRAGPWRNEQEPAVKWKPSIHMTRWASRITLEVVAVRVERVQDISEADAIAEGVTQAEAGCLTCGIACVNQGGCGNYNPSYRDGFTRLWHQINGESGPNSWRSDPWVWVVEFKRLTNG